MIAWLGAWVGWGWGGALIVWLLGAAFILLFVDRLFQSRLSTAVVMVVWTVLLLAATTRLFGIKPP
ncbi:MAG TPA: hypothetical protein VMU36_00230 [Spirochaetia bacterium]|nr:hypothetical protein [Spirochaetia bacterium]